MAGADIGGDDSVQWTINVDNVRHPTLKQESKGTKGWRHEGVDDVDLDEKFTVSIKIPSDSAEFVKTLRDAADEADRHASQPGFRVSFTLPIEQRNHDQIQIRWRSKP